MAKPPTLSPRARARLHDHCSPVVSAIDDPTDLRWIARDYRDHADLEVELPADARDLLRDAATTLELGALLIELAPVLDTLSATTPPAVADSGPDPEAVAGSGPLLATSGQTPPASTQAPGPDVSLDGSESGGVIRPTTAVSQ